MKKLLLLTAVAMTAFLSSCSKEDPASASLVSKLSSMFNQPVDQALVTAKSLGFDLIVKSSETAYICYKDTSSIQSLDNKINIIFNARDENKVINLLYTNTGTVSDIASEAKSLAQQTGASRTVDNTLVNFIEGNVDSNQGISSYSDFLQKIGNTTSSADCLWTSQTQIPVIYLSVEAGEQTAMVLYGVSIGG